MSATAPAVNGKAATDRAFTRPVPAPTDAPTPIPIGDRTDAEGDAASPAVGATGTDLMFSVPYGLPDGLTIDPATGVIRGTPAATRPRTPTARRP